MTGRADVAPPTTSTLVEASTTSIHSFDLHDANFSVHSASSNLASALLAIIRRNDARRPEAAPHDALGVRADVVIASVDARVRI